MARVTGLCFPSPAGGRRANSGIQHAVTRLSRRASFELTLHDLRRTFADMLAERNVPATRIRDYLGHSSIATTETYYVGRSPVVRSGDGDKLSLGIAATGTGLPPARVVS